VRQDLENERLLGKMWRVIAVSVVISCGAEMWVRYGAWVSCLC
jgi:hypothetical protein